MAQHAKNQRAQKRKKALSTSTSAAMIPQNHPLDSLKTQILYIEHHVCSDVRKGTVAPIDCPFVTQLTTPPTGWTWFYLVLKIDGFGLQLCTYELLGRQGWEYQRHRTDLPVEV
jgi:hypothetical protein